MVCRLRLTRQSWLAKVHRQTPPSTDLSWRFAPPIRKLSVPFLGPGFVDESETLESKTKERCWGTRWRSQGRQDDRPWLSVPEGHRCSKDKTRVILHSHADYICFALLHSVLSNVSSNWLPMKMQSHIGCICLVFIQCALSNGPLQRMHSPIGCICLTFLRCAFSNVSSSRLPEWMHHHTDCICVTFLNLPAWEEA